MVSARFAESITLGTEASQFEGATPPAPSYTMGPGSSTAGTVGGVFDLHWESGVIVIAPGGSTTLTLSSLVDAQGRSVPLVRVRDFVVQVTVKSAPEDMVVLGGAATHPWVGAFSGTVNVKDGLGLVSVSPQGYPVVAGTSDQLLITNPGAGAVSVQCSFKGCST